MRSMILATAIIMALSMNSPTLLGQHHPVKSNAYRTKTIHTQTVKARYGLSSMSAAWRALSSPGFDGYHEDAYLKQNEIPH